MKYTDKDLDIIVSQVLSQVDEIELPDGFHNKLLGKINAENNQIVSRETNFGENNQISSHETKKKNIFEFKKYTLLAAAIAIMFISIKYMKPVDMVTSRTMLEGGNASMSNQVNAIPKQSTVQNSDGTEKEDTLKSTQAPTANAAQHSAALMAEPPQPKELPYVDTPIFAIGLLAILLVFIKIIQLKSKTK